MIHSLTSINESAPINQSTYYIYLLQMPPPLPANSRNFQVPFGFMCLGFGYFDDSTYFKKLQHIHILHDCTVHCTYCTCMTTNSVLTAAPLSGNHCCYLHFQHSADFVPLFSQIEPLAPVCHRHKRSSGVPDKKAQTNIRQWFPI